MAPYRVGEDCPEGQENLKMQNRTFQFYSQHLLALGMLLMCAGIIPRVA